MKLVDRRAECGMLDRLVEAPLATPTGGTQISINTANLSLVVGAAVTLDELSRHLTDHGVSCAAIPSESVRRTVGELIANPRPAEQQDVRHALLGLEVVLPDGQASARFGGENMKDVAGYDTKRLFTVAAARSGHHHRHLRDLCPRRLVRRNKPRKRA
jgi:glycolate oxidase